MKTVGEKAKWQHKVKKFILLESQLFYEEKKGQKTLVVQRYQVATILYIVHNYFTKGY